MSLSKLSNVAFSQFSNRLSLDGLKSDVSSIQKKLSNVRPPQEFFDVKRVSKPQNFSEIQSRVSYNLKYFSANYAIVITMLSIYSLLTNLLLLFVLVFVGAGVFGISKLGGQDLELGFARFNNSQLYTGLLLIALPLGFLASPISTLIWLIGASLITVGTHASFLEKPVETAFEEEV